jgi:aminoglycoside 2''-phosphotransferase
MTTTEEYTQIIHACFPNLPIHSCAFVSQGWDSVAVAVNGEYIFRFPKRVDVEPQYQMEARLLPELAGAVSLPIPRFEFVWDGGAAYERRFVGYRMLAGEQLSCAKLADAPGEALAAELGRFLSELHRFPVKRAAQLLVPGGDAAEWRQRYRALYSQIEAQVLPMLDGSAQSQVAARWCAFLEEEQHFRFASALVHNDLCGDHILFDPQRGEITGIIDWGDATIGDVAIDFAGLLDDYGPDFVEQVMAHYSGPVDTTFRWRTAFYRYVMPFHEVLFGLATAQPRHVEHGLKTLKASF